MTPHTASRITESSAVGSDSIHLSLTIIQNLDSQNTKGITAAAAAEADTPDKEAAVAAEVGAGAVTQTVPALAMRVRFYICLPCTPQQS